MTLLESLDQANEDKVQAAVWRAMRLAGVRLDTPGAQHAALAITWLVRQQPKILYRFPPGQNDGHTMEGFGQKAYWSRKFASFMNRATVLTLESPQGRQAVAEHAAAAVGLLASTWRVGGPPASADEDWRGAEEQADRLRKKE